ncbi:MAG: methyltransferase domain-containing protein [Bacteroidetes bacterium]|nr:MAG: methyltransferase domain-containing protein [Bacteroidota bacterium]
MKNVLNIGSGPLLPDKLPAFFRMGGWQEVRLDVDPVVTPDIVSSVTDMPSIPGGSFKAIWSSHNLEHLHAFEVKLALAECRRILQPDGFFLMTCPDLLQTIAQLIVDGKINETIIHTRIDGKEGPPITPLDVLYGHDHSIQAGRTAMAHKTGFTAESLQQLLIGAGFQFVALARYSFDLWAVAYPGSTDHYHYRILEAAIRKNPIM